MKASPDLSRTTEFLVVAATLLDMKAARLLPRIDDEERASEADLEARDLLFSRLLQYRAFKEASKDLDARMGQFASYVAREAPEEPRAPAARAALAHDPRGPGSPGRRRPVRLSAYRRGLAPA